MSLPPLGVFRGPLLLYFQAWRLSRAVSSICLPPDFGTTQRKTDPCPGPPAMAGWGWGVKQWGDHPFTRFPPAPPPPSRGTYAGSLRQPHVQCPFRDILGRSGFQEQQQEAERPADLPPAAAHPAAGQRHFLPDGQRRGAPSPPGRSWKWGAEVCTACRTASAPLRVPGIMCLHPAPAPSPPPPPTVAARPPARPAHRVIFSRPYYIWPQRLLRRQRQQTGATGWLGDVAGSGPVTLR